MKSVVARGTDLRRCYCYHLSVCAAMTPPTEAGVSGYVHKPIRPAQLLESLCRAMSIQLQREKKAPAAPPSIRSQADVAAAAFARGRQSDESKSRIKRVTETRISR